ncbi:MAG: glutamate formimidoyltransferase [Deltaproteobacteria bacterium]|nr:MAG: glutamate formimidoyltransferase [Deltaproteobacteria bacterium]
MTGRRGRGGAAASRPAPPPRRRLAGGAVEDVVTAPSTEPVFELPDHIAPDALVECVPNFSEGRDPAVIAEITRVIEATDGVTLLDVDPGKATNRTVVTFVGTPAAVLLAAWRAIAKAAEQIDMRHHQGAHPRMGATDVCPLVPVRGITMEQCAELAHILGAAVGEGLGVPVYYYEAAATRPERANLAAVRAGEYEGLAARLVEGGDPPDAGPTLWSDDVARTGATAIGARPFLIAFNINLNTTHTRKAMKIAALIREKGIIRRDERGEIVRDADGRAVRDPGLFKKVKAIGWYIEEYGRCQVSINFTDYTVSSLHDVVDATRRVADQEGVVVTGSELVGLVPLDAMLRAGRHYLARQGLNPGAPDSELVEVAIQSLGLRDLGPFDPRERIIEYRIQQDGPLVGKTVRDFVDTLASRAPAPGGGSVAALCGALSAGLVAMVGQLTTGKKGYEAQAEAQNDAAVAAQALKEGFLADIDADTAAFNGIMAAFALPKGTPEEKRARRAAIQAATREAIEVPLRVLERTVQALPLIEVALQGNDNARSDAAVAALTARACAEGAFYNVRINLGSFRDEAFAAEARQRADAALATVRQFCDEVSARMADEL